jgi:hypothetical protein
VNVSMVFRRDLLLHLDFCVPVFDVEATLDFGGEEATTPYLIEKKEVGICPRSWPCGVYAPNRHCPDAVMVGF